MCSELDALTMVQTLLCASCPRTLWLLYFSSTFERLIQGEDYLGIVKWRFYGRCPHCRAEICFKTGKREGGRVFDVSLVTMNHLAFAERGGSAAAGRRSAELRLRVGVGRDAHVRAIER